VARIGSGRQVVPRLIHMVGTELVPVADQATLGLNPDHLAAVQRGMFEVMNNERGTGKRSRIVDETMLMAGKTGTAQVRNFSQGEAPAKNDTLPWKLRDHALFVCFAPFDAPKYAVAVVVEHGGGGSLVAAPIARDVLLRCLTGGIPPLAAYPADQRNRIETQFKEMPLRDVGPEGPVRIRA
jgi:penicillin-binding protein 2